MMSQDQMITLNKTQAQFYDKIHEALGVDVIREDEMECLIIGMVSPLIRFFNVAK